MPLPIRPEGMFHGERLQRCSRDARLWWPYLFCASNNAARLRLHYPDLLRSAFAGFNPPPTTEEVARYVAEYRREFLLFVYHDPATGDTWGVWDTSSLPPNAFRFDAAARRTSPAPPAEELATWLAEYQRLKAARTMPLITGKVPSGRQRTEPHGESPCITEPHGESPCITESHGDSPLEVSRVEGSRGDKYKNKKHGAFVLPEWVDRDTWAAFEEMRRTKRKPMTDKARVLTVRDLAKLRAAGEDPTAVLERSIQRAWTGVFSTRDNAGARRPAKGGTRDASDAAQARRKAREINTSGPKQQIAKQEAT